MLLRIIFAALLGLLSRSLHAQENYSNFKTLAETEDTAAVRNLLTKWSIENPNDPELYVARFNYHILVSRRKLGSADVVPKGFIESTGNYLTAALYYYDTLKIEKGIKTINEGIEKFPNRLDLYFGKAWLLGDLGRFAEQDSFIKTILKRSAKPKQTWLWTENEELKEAKTFILKSLQEYVTRLFDYQRLNDVISIEQTTLSYYPDNFKSFIHLAVCDYYANDFKKALSLLHRAEKIAPHDPEVLTHLAYAYKHEKENKKAINYYERLLKYGDTGDKEFATNELKELKGK
jgi:tetratricopeptide (TPR) repeat protein